MNILLPKTIVRFQDNRDNRGDNSEKDYRSSENNPQKDDPDKLKPHFNERQDLGASSTYKERKLGMIGMSTLALAGLMALASPLLAMAIAFPVLHWRMSKPPQEPPRKDDLDLERRQKRIDDLQKAIDNARDDANYRDQNLPPDQLKPLKPILKKSLSPATNSSQIDALDLASSSKPVQAGIDGRTKQSNLAGDLAGIAENLKGDPRPDAGEAKPKRRVRFGPDQVRKI